MSPLPPAQVALHAQFAATFGAHVPRALRLHILSRRLRVPVNSTSDLSEDEQRDLTRWLWIVNYAPFRRDEILRRAAEELSPDPAPVAAADAALQGCQQSRAALSNTDTALALLDRIGEASHDARFAVGDAGLILCAMAPEASRREVLAEHLRGREHDQLRAFLCPAFPPLENLQPEEALRYEASAVRTWLEVCRIAERVPKVLRDTFPGLGFGYFRAAATTLELRDGKRVIPSEKEIARRLAAVADNEHAFHSPQDLRAWIRTGELPERVPAAKPDLAGEALLAFKAYFHERDSIAEAWSATFGTGAPYTIRRTK